MLIIWKRTKRTPVIPSYTMGGFCSPSIKPNYTCMYTAHTHTHTHKRYYFVLAKHCRDIRVHLQTCLYCLHGLMDLAPNGLTHLTEATNRSQNESYTNKTQNAHEISRSLSPPTTSEARSLDHDLNEKWWYAPSVEKCCNIIIYLLYI